MNDASPRLGTFKVVTRESFYMLISVLALGANAGTLVLLALWAAGRRPVSPAGRLAMTLRFPTMIAAIIVTGAATISSLTMSEHFNMMPCRLCWFQRVFMYPLPVLMTVLMLCKERRAARITALTLAIPGALIAGWHALIEQYPNLEGDSCDPLNPCSSIWYRTFGFVGIPYGAMACFLFAIAAALYSGRGSKHARRNAPTPRCSPGPLSDPSQNVSA